jgi:uncharacterized protein
MKNIVTVFFAILLANLLIAQSQPVCNPFPKTISVTGSAAMEVIPDEIYVQVDLKEYKKKGEEKTDIDKIKTEFLASCKAAGVADSNISVSSYDGNNIANTWKGRKKDPDLFASITYQLKFNNTKLLDDLVNRLDDEATNNFRITSTSHSKIVEYRKQLKIMAVKAAKEKAIYLAESVNEQVGPAITITEPEEPDSDIRAVRLRGENSFYSNTISQSNSDNSVDYRKLKLRFEVEVKFALK